MNPNKNWYCDNTRCTKANGEVKVYPLGGGANLILCQACWAHENSYRAMRAAETKRPEAFPQNNWADAELYEPSK